MSPGVNYDGRLPLVVGAVAGIVAWLVGYALTFLAVGSEIQDSAAQRFVEAVQGEPATYEMVGWVFYNAHLVDTVYTDVPAIGELTTSAIGGEEGFSVLLYLIPVGLLLAAGLAVSRMQGVESAENGVLVGVTIVPGYLLLSIVGLFLFEVSVGAATGGPGRIEAVVLAGIVYPAAFAGAGGVLAALTAE